MTDSAASQKLEKEITEGRLTISAEGYSMSIGELTNLYRDDELLIRPAFQRLFRWDLDQKSKLVESILLGIPLPSIFVAQDQDGKWELVDGLQRVSTILQLQGELRDESGARRPALELSGTKLLKGLEGATWDGSGSGPGLTPAQQLDFKRSKIDVKIIKRGSSEKARYDLFQRLNSYGSVLTAQEIRSAMLVGANPAFQEWLQELASHTGFVNTVALSDRELDEQYDLELVLRFLVLHNRTDLNQSSLRRFTSLLDDEALELATDLDAKGRNELGVVFNETFSVLGAAGRDAFRKWDTDREEFVRGFLNTAFEVIGLGLGYHVASGGGYRTDVLDAARELWKRPDMTTRFATGLSTESRLARMIPLGRELMAAPQP